MENTTKIKDMRENENVVIEGTVLEIFEPKQIVKKSGELISLQEVLVDDKEASITLKLWDKQVGTIKENQKIKIHGYVSGFRGALSISTGKYGKIEIIQ